jgi:hypothetical protein
MDTAKIAKSLLDMTMETQDHIAGQAVEIYNITRHYQDDEDIPELDDSDALRDLIGRVGRSAVALALGYLAANHDVSMPESVRELLVALATELDVQALEIEDGA